MTIFQVKIVWVQYPFSDNPSKYKHRPALVISSSKALSIDNDVILLPITSSLHNDFFSFRLHDEYLKEGALPKTSEVRCHKPATVRAALIIGELNNVTYRALNSIKQKVEVAIALGDQPIPFDVMQ